MALKEVKTVKYIRNQDNMPVWMTIEPLKAGKKRLSKLAGEGLRFNLKDQTPEVQEWLLANLHLFKDPDLITAGKVTPVKKYTPPAKKLEPKVEEVKEEQKEEESLFDSKELDEAAQPVEEVKPKRRGRRPRKTK